MATGQRRFDLEVIGDVTVAKFLDKRILDEANIQEISDTMLCLLDNDECRKIVLDFSRVEYLSSWMLGKLVAMDKKAKTVNAKLRLCCIRPEIYEAFVIVGLHKTFDVKLTLNEGLEDF